MRVVPLSKLRLSWVALGLFQMEHSAPTDVWWLTAFQLECMIKACWLSCPGLLSHSPFPLFHSLCLPFKSQLASGSDNWQLYKTWEREMNFSGLPIDTHTQTHAQLRRNGFANSILRIPNSHFAAISLSIKWISQIFAELDAELLTKGNLEQSR